MVLGIYTNVLFGILFGIYFGCVSDIYARILSGILSAIPIPPWCAEKGLFPKTAIIFAAWKRTCCFAEKLAFRMVPRILYCFSAIFRRFSTNLRRFVSAIFLRELKVGKAFEGNFSCRLTSKPCSYQNSRENATGRWHRYILAFYLLYILAFDVTYFSILSGILSAIHFCNLLGIYSDSLFAIYSDKVCVTRTTACDDINKMSSVLLSLLDRNKSIIE